MREGKDISTSVTVVVPVFNGAGCLDELVQRCRRSLSTCSTDHEIILVNDGSSDRSWSTIERLAAESPDIRGIDLCRNYGQHNALLAGVHEACGETIVTVDDDLQNPPEEIPKLLTRLGADCDVVYGVPETKRQNLGRRIATRIVVRGLRALGGSTAPMVSSFRAFRTSLRAGFAGYRGPDVSIDGLLTWRTDRFCSVRVRHDPRRHGSSNYSLIELVRHALTMITAFSTRPLRLATMVGFAVIAFGFAVLAYVLVRFVAEGSSVPGFPFLVSIISVFSGAQLFAIGVIGEYLARMHVRVMARPSYAVRARVGGTTALPASSPVGVTVDGEAERGEDEQVCRLLAWDSQFWEFPVARVTLRSIDRRLAGQIEHWCDREGVRCTYFLAAAADATSAAAAEQVGFRSVDTRIELERPAGLPVPNREDVPSLSVRPAMASDRAAVVSIARSAHTDTRFHFDPRFDRERAHELYAVWIAKGFERPSSLLVAEREGDIVGYVLTDREGASIELIAVADSVRRSAVGSSLVAAALRALDGRSCNVVTQARNVAALRLYDGCGFRVVSTDVWYHRWS